MDKNKTEIKDKMSKVRNMIEEEIKPYVLDHMDELDDDWTEDDIRDIENAFDDVELPLSYLAFVVDELCGIKH